MGRLFLYTALGVGTLGALLIFFAASDRNLQFNTAASIFSGALRDAVNIEKKESPIFDIDLTVDDVPDFEKAQSKKIQTEGGDAKISGVGTFQSGGEKDAVMPRSFSVKRGNVSSATNSLSSTSPAVALSYDAKTPDCSLVSAGEPTRRVLINEIAWMGRPDSANDEWIELRNNSDKEIALLGWQLVSQSGNIKVAFGGNDKILPRKFFLLERTDDTSVPNVSAQKIYVGVLSNEGERLMLFDEECKLVDEVDGASGWSALGGNNDTKQTLERASSSFSWQTSRDPLGTPGAENSDGEVKPVSSPSSYRISVSKRGDGDGKIVSNPAGISCGEDCSESYPYGTAISLTAEANANSIFDGWSGACSGRGECRIEVNEEIFLVAAFRAISPALPPVSYQTVDHIVIAEVQITGGTGKANNDFIKLLNPTGSGIDLSGWKLRKRTQPGGESSIRVFPEGSMIEAGGYFIWANSDDGFAESVHANVSSTQTLASNNSIALFDNKGAVIDALAWGSGHTNPFVEGSPYPENPAGGEVLKRKTRDGVLQDTDSNSADFEKSSI